MKISQLKEAIRQVVREELREVLREELSTVEQPVEQEPIFEEPKKRPLHIPKSGNDTLDNILNETANSEWKSIGTFGASQAQSFMPQQQMMGNTMTTPPATSVDGFLSQNKQPGASDVRQVQVNSVPDFSKMMGTMKDKGMV